MRDIVQTFSTSLLDHVRTSNELDIILNYDPDPSEEPWEPGERPALNRLKLAIKYKLKSVSFIRHMVTENEQIYQFLEVIEKSTFGINLTAYRTVQLSYF